MFQDNVDSLVPPEPFKLRQIRFIPPYFAIDKKCDIILAAIFKLRPVVGSFNK